jgi:hypothetical protein
MAICTLKYISGFSVKLFCQLIYTDFVCFEIKKKKTPQGILLRN